MVTTTIYMILTPTKTTFTTTTIAIPITTSTPFTTTTPTIPLSTETTTTASTATTAQLLIAPIPTTPIIIITIIASI